MQKLLKHQQDFLDRSPDKCLLIWEGGVGKTVAAAVWLHDGRDEDALVVCPKRIVKKWQDTLKEWDTKATVLSKDDFKKQPIKHWSALVIDEADEFASPLFLKGRSQLSAQMYELIRAYDMPTLLLTATPIRSTPWNLHTLLCFYGTYIDWKKWREEFFTLESRPFVQWKAWFPKSDWRTRIRPHLEKYADIVLLKDCVSDLPPIQESVMELPLRKWTALKDLDVTPTARFVAEHKYEQELKLSEILAIGKEYRKVLVVAYYVEQIEALNKQLSKDRETFMVHGSVRNQEELLEQAQRSDECYLIVQASLGAGFDADTFSCIVFVSMSYKVRDFVQMKYRVRRIHNLHPVQYYYLLGGRCDKQVYEKIQEGRDFVPSEWSS